MKPKVLICARRLVKRRKYRYPNKKPIIHSQSSSPFQSSERELQPLIISLVNKVARLEEKIEENQSRLEGKLDLLLKLMPQSSHLSSSEIQKLKREEECNQQYEAHQDEEAPLKKEKTPIKRLRWVDNTPPRRTYTFRQATAAEASTDCILKLLREEATQQEKGKENQGTEQLPSINILEAVAERQKLEESQGFAFIPRRKKATAGSSGASPLLLTDIEIEPKTAAESEGPSEEDEILKLLNRSAHASNGSSFINQQEINIATADEEAGEEEDDVLSLLTQESPLQEKKQEKSEFVTFEEIAENQQSILNTFRTQFATKRAQRYMEG